MKFSKIVLSVAFAIIFSNIAYCDTLYKEQTVINKQKNIIEYISSDGNTTHKTLEKTLFLSIKTSATTPVLLKTEYRCQNHFFFFKQSFHFIKIF